MVLLQLHGDELPNARARLPSAVEHDPLISQAALEGAQCGQHASQGNARGALNVVVEAAQLIAVLLQQPAAMGTRVDKAKLQNG